MESSILTTSFPEIYMPCPFAGEADKGGTSGTNRSNKFPDTKSAANVNMRTGFPSVYTQSRAANGKYLSRPDMNQLGYMATVGTFRRQAGCLNEYSTSFANLVGGYPKGAVLDYAVKESGSIVEVWKIVSLEDGNKTQPNADTIADFKSGVDGKKWLKVAADFEYIENVRTECRRHTDTSVSAERTRAERVEAQKIDSEDALNYFTSAHNQRQGQHDGTAKDASGNAVRTHNNGAVTGHVHTNVYTKDEIDEMLIEAGGSEYTSGVDQEGGFHNGTYSRISSGSSFIEKGHFHSDYAKCNTGSSNQFDGTAYSSSDGSTTTNSLSEVKRGHVHTNLVDRSEVYTKIECNSNFARGSSSTVGAADGTARNSSDGIVVPTFSGDPARGSYLGVTKGHYHTNYATTEYVKNIFSSMESGVSVTEESNSMYIELPNDCIIQCGTANYSKGDVGSVTTKVSRPFYANVRCQTGSSGDDNDYGIGCYATIKKLEWYVYYRRNVWNENSTLYWIVVGFK